MKRGRSHGPAKPAFIAPSAVSKRLSDIEARFGTPLPKRSKRGVEPTPAGLALLPKPEQRPGEQPPPACWRAPAVAA
ncbi:LysR family transcriptional regulator [Pseudomonas corrugata]|nr:LysR family transcriptional regulator [Pseudomonas corrugata]